MRKAGAAIRAPRRARRWRRRAAIHVQRFQHEQRVAFVSNSDFAVMIRILAKMRRATALLKENASAIEADVRNAGRLPRLIGRGAEARAAALQLEGDLPTS